MPGSGWWLVVLENSSHVMPTAYRAESPWDQGFEAMVCFSSGLPSEARLPGSDGPLVPSCTTVCKLATSVEAGKSVRRIFFHWRESVWPGERNEFCFGSENTTCLHIANVLRGCKSIDRHFRGSLATGLSFWGESKESGIFLHSSNSLDFYLSDTFHVAMAFALSPDFGSMLSKKAESLMVPTGQIGYTEDGSNHIPLGPIYCCSTGWAQQVQQNDDEVGGFLFNSLLRGKGKIGSSHHARKCANTD